jgi:hypothetical protein
MTLKLLESSVLLGVPAVRGAAAGVERVDSKQGPEQNPACQSHPRHLALDSPDTDYPTSSRLPFAMPMGMAGAVRAGRSGCLAGVSVCRGPALAAGRGNPQGWPRIAGAYLPSITWRLTELSGKRRMAGRLMRSGRSPGLLPLRAQALTAARGRRADLRSAQGTPWTSTRGTNR